MLEQVSAIWNSLLSSLDALPEDSIAVTVYVIGTMIVLWCWYGVAKRLPRMIGGISWIVLFAVLATPTVSDGANAEIAPAIFGLLFGILTKEQSLVWANASLILFVVGVGLVIGYLWSKYRMNKTASNESSTPI